MQCEFLLIANWKMQLTYKQAVTAARMYAHAFGDVPFVLCPSFESLSAIKHELVKTRIMLGAQDVSAYAMGAYTGQVSAASLKELGCSYCIVGHSEQRTYNHETDSVIAQKVELLLMMGIAPIICVGETLEQRDAGQTLEVVRSQLTSLMPVLDQKEAITLYFAYEPVWAIGSSEQPTVESIAVVAECIEDFFSAWGDSWRVRIIYGGGVTVGNAREL